MAARVIFAQRRSVAKSVIGCFQRRLFVRLFVCGYFCLFLCQHDNLRTSKHRTMKLGGTCIVQNYRSSSNLVVIAPLGAHPLKRDVGKISVGCAVSQNANNV